MTHWFVAWFSKYRPSREQWSMWVSKAHDSLRGGLEVDRMLHIWMSYVVYMNESCRTYEWVMSCCKIVDLWAEYRALSLFLALSRSVSLSLLLLLMPLSLTLSFGFSPFLQLPLTSLSFPFALVHAHTHTYTRTHTHTHAHTHARAHTRIHIKRRE